MEKIDEGNKLIQDFMGWELINLDEDFEDDDEGCWVFKNKETGYLNSGYEGFFYNKDSIKTFNTWNELKPVIDKCFKELKELGIDRRAGWNPSHGYAPNLISLGLDCTLNQAWESVVFSIKFINEKSKR